MAVIEVSHLTKDYGSGRGVFDVTFGVEKGEVFGFLGPNGAGKTTTIRHLMGFSYPQNGQTKVNNMLCSSKISKILENVGYLPGEIALPEALTGLEFIKMMQGLRKCYDEKRLKHLLNIFQLDPNGKTKRMSLGDKRKLAVITAFMADPEILILDEPTSGLDPIMQEAFIKFMLEEKQRGKTILLSSHIFSEVDAICDRIAIIKEGKIVSIVDANEIRHNQNKMYQIVFSSPSETSRFKSNTKFTVSRFEIAKNLVEVSIKDDDINKLIRSLTLFSMASFREIPFTLENYFMHFYAKEEKI